MITIPTFDSIYRRHFTNRLAFMVFLVALLVGTAASLAIKSSEAFGANSAQASKIVAVMIAVFAVTVIQQRRENAGRKAHFVMSAMSELPADTLADVVKQCDSGQDVVQVNDKAYSVETVSDDKMKFYQLTAVA